MAQSAAPVAAYSFDADAGTTLTDITGNNNTVTLLKGPVLSGGRYGAALSFDGVDDVGVANNPNAALNLAGGGFTLSAWIYPRTNSGWQMIVNKPYGSTHSPPYFDWSMHRQNSTGRLVVFLGCESVQRTSNASTPLNTWTHVAVTYDGASLRHYINGVQDRTTSVSCAITNTNSRPIRLGANSSGYEVMNGSIDDVRIYNRPLSASEIRSDLATALGGAPSPVDNSAPTVSITAPAGGATLSGTVSVSASASDNVGVTGVQFKVDGQNLAAEDQSAPFAVAWNTAQWPNGNHSLSATARDAAGNSAASGSVAASVDNGTIDPPSAPTLSFTANPGTVGSGGSATLNWTSAYATSCSASGAWSGNQPTAGSASTGALTAPDNTFTLNCSGPGGSVSRAAVVRVSGASPLTGLDFPGSAATNNTVRFRFTNPLAIYPATYLWKVKPRQQTGYYTTFFWGNDGPFYWGNPPMADTFYGAHPYPQGDGSTHKWEIAVNASDFVSNESVVYDLWYSQALRVWSDGSGKHHEFYWDLPNTSRVVRVDLPTSYGNLYPPNPALTWGDAPWNHSNEIMNGVIRGIQIYSSSLSVSDLLSEQSSALSTSNGASSIWYLNLDPTPADISDKSGAGHHPQWVGPERARLWTSP